MGGPERCASNPQTICPCGSDKPELGLPGSDMAFGRSRTQTSYEVWFAPMRAGWLTFSRYGIGARFGALS